MCDAVMVRREAVVNSPQDSLGPTADSDLAVDRADVRLHGVPAEICQRRDLGVALALRNEGQDLRLTIAEASPRPGQSSPTALRARGGASLTTVSPACTASSAATNSRAGSVFDR